jgi:hypothetical protein
MRMSRPVVLRRGLSRVMAILLVLGATSLETWGQ